jgi:hypothetical protein
VASSKEFGRYVNGTLQTLEDEEKIIGEGVEKVGRRMDWEESTGKGLTEITTLTDSMILPEPTLTVNADGTIFTLSKTSWLSLTSMIRQHLVVTFIFDCKSWGGDIRTNEGEMAMQ